MDMEARAARVKAQRAAAGLIADNELHARNRRVNAYCSVICAIGVASFVAQVWL
jgi:hypothetical protein